MALGTEECLGAMSGRGTEGGGAREGGGAAGGKFDVREEWGGGGTASDGDAVCVQFATGGDGGETRLGSRATGLHCMVVGRCWFVKL
jgi:hypothetical protein